MDANVETTGTEGNERERHESLFPSERLVLFKTKDRGW
jgi:hypothetical protein